MAYTVHLFLKANGSDVQGESSQVSLGRENSIECVEYSSEVTVGRDVNTGLSQGKRQHRPVRITKAIDKSSPLLFKACTMNAKVDGEFKFFRSNPSGDGTVEHFYTVKIENGRIENIKKFVPNSLTEEGRHLPFLEEVSFVFHTITEVYVKGGVEHVDNWAQT